MYFKEKLEHGIKKDNELIEFLTNLKYVTQKISIKLKHINSGIMNNIKPYIKSQAVLKELDMFYKNFINIENALKDMKQSFKKENLKSKNIINLKDLDEIEILNKINELNKYKEELKNYKDVKIVKELINDIDDFIESLNKKIMKAFFKSLNILPKIEEISIKYSFYLQKINWKKKFFQKYTKKVYDILNFYKINDTFNGLVQQTENLTIFFNLIISINKKLIKPSMANSINSGLIKMMVINLKKIILERIRIVENENNVSNLPNLIKLYGGLKHGDGLVIKEIEYLFDLKENILKSIQNHFIMFFKKLDDLKYPNKKNKTEELLIILKNVINSFKINKKVEKAWFDKYGKYFKLSNKNEIKTKFTIKCFNKIDKLAKELDDLSKSIYLINNYYELASFIKKHKNKNIKELINCNINIILGLLQFNIVSNNDKVKEILKKITKYGLPIVIKSKIKDKIKTSLVDLFVNRAIDKKNVNKLSKIIDKFDE